MKRLLPLLLLLLFLTPALAEDDPAALFLSAHPGWEIVSADTNGGTAAAILAHESEQTLCIAERANGAWVLTADNPNALRTDAIGSYTVAVAAEDSVSWTLCHPDWEVEEICGVVRQDGTWWMSPLIFKADWNGNPHAETVLLWRDGKLTRTEELRDQSGALTSAVTLMPLPASWLDSMTSLPAFDANLLPAFSANSGELDYSRCIVSAAGELLPDYTYVGSALLDDELQLLMDKPDGTRVFVGVIWDNGWQLTESAPLPADARYGNENFTDYLYIPGTGTIGVRHWPDGSWGVNYLMPDDGEIMLLGQNYVSDGYVVWAETLLVGDHPWSDLKAIDWSTLPRTTDEARARIDHTNWAMVNNPNPEDRLHLRSEPDRNSATNGKYYNGTFVRVLEQKDGWTRVNAFGLEGWMMTDYLAFGKDMETVQRALAPWSVADTLSVSGKSAILHALTGDAVLRTFDGEAIVLSVIGDWFHVWLEETGESGFVRQEELWPGNG